MGRGATRYGCCFRLQAAATPVAAVASQGIENVETSTSHPHPAIAKSVAGRSVLAVAVVQSGTKGLLGERTPLQVFRRLDSPGWPREDPSKYEPTGVPNVVRDFGVPVSR
jgi:hypothetical protein